MIRQIQRNKMIKTLENITEKILPKIMHSPEVEQMSEIEKNEYKIEAVQNYIHTAGILALVAAAKRVTDQHIMPTPLYRIEDGESLEIKNLNGKAPVPTPNTLDLNLVDMITASTLRGKLHLLFEGKTGTGKTFTVEEYLKAILPPEAFRILRLNPNMSNILEPWVETYLKNDVDPAQRLRDEQIDDIAAVFIDEISRGDSNQAFQLLDNVISLPEQRRELGIHIPEYNGENWKFSQEKRPLQVIAAQNPPVTSKKGAGYGQSRTLDEALGNRLTKIEMPNTASVSGAALTVLKNGKKQHEEFIEAFIESFEKNLDVGNVDWSNLKEDYIALYAFITDPRKTKAPVLQSGLEFSDSMLTLLTGDIVEEITNDLQVTQDLTKKLKEYRIDFTYNPFFDSTTKAITHLKSTASSFREEVINRDVTKVRNIADAFSITRRIKKALSQENSVEVYNNTESYITVRDIAPALALVLSDKQEKKDSNIQHLITQGYNDYVEIVNYVISQTAGEGLKFDANNPSTASYNLMLRYALGHENTNSEKGELTSEDDTIRFIQNIGQQVAGLKRAGEGSECKKPILARMIANLTTLASFAHDYSDEIRTIAAEKQQGIREFKELYIQEKEKGNLPDLYKQRLPIVLGV